MRYHSGTMHSRGTKAARHVEGSHSIELLLARVATHAMYVYLCYPQTCHCSDTRAIYPGLQQQDGRRCLRNQHPVPGVLRAIRTSIVLANDAGEKAHVAACSMQAAAKINSADGAKVTTVHDGVERFAGNAHHQSLPRPHGAHLVVPAGTDYPKAGSGLRRWGKPAREENLAKQSLASHPCVQGELGTRHQEKQANCFD